MTDKYLLWIWLKIAVDDSSVKTSKLYFKYGDINRIYELTSKDLDECDFLDDDSKERLLNKSLDKAETIMRRCKTSRIFTVSIDDDRYPELLRHIDNPPCILFYYGNYDKAFSKPRITIVGTRKCTTYGETCTSAISCALAICGLAVVTGVAEGIDAYATKGTLKADGSVIAVAPSGLLELNVRTRNALGSYQINGVVISEHLPHTGTHQYAYHERNRILSGLSDATFVTQAPVKSGALITAGYAAEQGREVFVLPANIDMQASEGSNYLLRDGACPVFSHKDILEYYLPKYPDQLTDSNRAAEKIKYEHKDDIEREIEIEHYKKSVAEGLTSGERFVFSMFNQKEVALDYIINNTTFPVAEVSGILSSLEMQGLIKSLPGNKYKIII